MSQASVSSFFQVRKKSSGQPTKQKLSDKAVSQIKDVTKQPEILETIAKLQATPEAKNRTVSLDRTSKRDAFVKHLTEEDKVGPQDVLARIRASSLHRTDNDKPSSARKQLDLTAIKKTSKANVAFIKQGNLSPKKIKPQSPFKIEKKSLLSPRRLEAIDSLVSTALSNDAVPRSPLAKPVTPGKASPADVKKQLGSTNSLATLQARLRGLSQSETPKATARKALFVDDEKAEPRPFTSPTLSRKGFAIDVDVRKNVIPPSPVKASPRKQALEKAESVPDKIKDLLTSSENLPLPQTYKEVLRVFKKTDELVAIKFNRNQAIPLDSIKKDVQIALRKSLTDHQLKQIRCVLPKAYSFVWESKKDTRGRPTPDYEMYLSPTLDGGADRMTPRNLVERAKLFEHSLLTIVQDHHQEFLKKQGIDGIDNSRIQRWDKDFDVDQQCPDIDELDFPEKPLVESPERNPQAMLAKITGLNQSVEKALQRVVESSPKPSAKPLAMTPISKAVDDDIKLDPALRDLPPHLLAKIKAQEREKRIRNMTMDKGKEKEIGLLEELLHNRVSPFDHKTIFVISSNLKEKMLFFSGGTK